MQSKQEILFTLKVQGQFTPEGFVLDKTARAYTLIKFIDGSWELKLGRETQKRRWSVAHKLLQDSLEKSLGIELCAVSKYNRNFIKL